MSILTSINHGLFWHHSLTRLKKFGVTINPYYLVREGDVGNVDPEKLELPDNFRVEQLRSADITALEKLTRWATPDLIERRLKLGHLCLILRAGEDIAGYTWADPHSVNDAVCPYQLGPGEAYLFDAYVAENYRGGGLASKMRYASYLALRRIGMHSFVSLSDYFNTSSIKFKRRLGAQPVRLYIYIKLFGIDFGNWTLRSYEPMQNYWHSE